MKISSFSRGCFWCVEKDLEKLEGVIYAISSYTSTIYYNSEEEKKIITDIITRISEKNLHESEIITSVEEFINFYPAEKYHQDYYLKNPVRYNVYRTSSGRERFVNELQEKAKELQYLKD